MATKGKKSAPKSKAKSAVKARAKTVGKIKKAAKKASVTRLSKSPAKKSAIKRTTSSSSKSSAPAKVLSLSQARENRPKKIDWANFFTPVDDRILVELTKTPETTEAGLFLTDMAQPSQARVLAVGPGKRDKKGRRRPLDVQVGEKVLYADHAGSKLNLADRDLLLLSETDVLGILET